MAINPFWAKLGNRGNEAIRRWSDEWSVKHFIASISLPALNALLLHCFHFLLKLTFYGFIASRICLPCLNTLTTKNINEEAMKPMICFNKLKKYSYISVISAAQKLCRNCFYICVWKFCTVIWRFLHEFT
jgi:hypothetical protein